MTTIFDPIRIGDLDLPNRIIMAPLTRKRATDDRVPTALMIEHYVQRATAGLIISEGVHVSPQAVGHSNSPGIWTAQHIAGWKRLTDAVHAAGGHIFMQLWHVGRVSDPSYLNGELPVAPSAIALEGNVSLLYPKRPFVTPRALQTDEIPGLVETYRQGAQNAMAAGFDGVEIHGANGYLLDQFLHDSANKRTDRYGGSIENRARLMLEVTDACISVWGASRVGMHLSPRGNTYAMADSTPLATFTYVAQELGKRNIAFIFGREALGNERIGAKLKKTFGGVYMANEQFTLDTANQIIASGDADAVAFGKLFIANPDLPQRFQQGAPLNVPVPETFYKGGEKGYTDYPALN